MDTKKLQKDIKHIMVTGAGYGKEFKPTLKETYSLLKLINRGQTTAHNYAQLGELLIALEDSGMAADAFREALAVEPNHLTSLLYLGLLLEQMEQLDEAVRIYLQINQLDPDNTEIVQHVLTIAYSENNLDLVLLLCQHFLSQNTRYAAVYYFLSKVLTKASDYEKALVNISEARSIDPNNVEYLQHYLNLLFINREYKKLFEFHDDILSSAELNIANKLMLAKAYAEDGDLETSRTTFVSLLKAHKDLPTRMIVLNEIGLFIANYYSNADRACRIFNYIIKREADNMLAKTNAIHFSTMTEFEKYNRYRKLMAEHPDVPNIEFNYAITALCSGELEEGFKYYENRISLHNAFLANKIKMPDTLVGKKVYLLDEQGLGDKFFWAWFLKFLQRDAAEVVMQTDKRIIPILERSFPDVKFTDKGILEIIEQGDLNDYDAVMLQASAASYYQDEIYEAQKQFEQGQAIAPTLIADPEQCQVFEKRLSELTSLPVVGICWRSSILSEYRSSGYLTVEDIVEIFSGLKCKVLNLQYSYTEQEINYLKEHLGDKFIHFDDIDLRDDQDAIAAMMHACDLIFSAPTAVSTLAGVLGVKAIVMHMIIAFGKNYDVRASSLMSVAQSIKPYENLSIYRTAIKQQIESNVSD